MDKIIFATGNEGKMKEVRMILEDLGLPVLSLKDAGITADVEENGTTFEEIDSIDFEETDIDDDALFDEAYEAACEFEWECQTGR